MPFRIPLVTLVMALTLVGCDSDGGDDSQPGATEPAGTLTFAFQPQENPEGLQLDVQRFAEFIGERTNHEVEVFLPTNYASVVEALRSGNADVAYFSGLPYLHAHEMAGAQLLVVEERDGQPFYYSQWYALADSEVEDLADLEGRSIAFTSPSSTSGFLFPLAEVIDQGYLASGGDPQTFFDQVIYAGGYEQALRALVNGRVEAAAASDYALETYLSEAEQARLKVIARQGPVPTHGLAVHPELDEDLKEGILEALLELNEEEHRQLLSSVYGAQKLIPRDHDDHVSALQRAVKLVDLDRTL